MRQVKKAEAGFIFNLISRKKSRITRRRKKQNKLKKKKKNQKKPKKKKKKLKIENKKEEKENKRHGSVLLFLKQHLSEHYDQPTIVRILTHCFNQHQPQRLHRSLHNFFLHLNYRE